MYEVFCKTCQGKIGSDTNFIHVGESARSICERFRDHVDDCKANLESSHMAKHEALVHGLDMTKPEYDIRVKKFCKSAIERQVLEAVTIASRAEEKGVTILNSKSEFNRCTLPRIVMYCGENKLEEVQEGDPGFPIRKKKEGGG